MGNTNAGNEELVFLANAIKEGRKRRLKMQLALNNLAARRRRVLNLACLVLLLISHRNVTVPRPVRSCRRLKRNSGWWENVCNTYSDARFKKTFRVSRGTFNFILRRIEPFLIRQTVMEEPIPPVLRLAICLYRLSRGDYFYTIAEMSGLGVSTISSICQEVCQVLVDHLWNENVSSHMPQTEEEFKQKILDMEEFWQFPCCWTALDGCHIPMKCPPGGLQSCKEYHNFKNFYSIVLMAMVDSHYRFVWGSCGFPGNSHDAVIFRSTDLWTRIQEGLIPVIGKTVGDVTVPPLVVGDSAFPLRTWLMKPYTNAILTPKQRYFNYRLSRARMVTEGAYGQLKGRWRVLLRKSESSQDNVRITTLACMVLHNICIARGDAISKKLDLSLDANGQKRNREEIRKLLQMRNCSSIRDVSLEANKVRNALCEKLWLEKETGKVC